MPLFDEKGRFFGKLSIIDTAIVLVVCVCAAALYAVVTRTYRVPAPYPADPHHEWLAVDIRLPQEQSWMVACIEPGARQLSARGQIPMAEIVGATLLPEGDVVVKVKLYVVRDTQGRPVWDNELVTPGRGLLVRTPSCYVEGRVSAVGPGEGAAGAARS